MSAYPVVVGIDDIKAVCFECLKCGARISLPPGGIREIPQQCPRGDRWGPMWRSAYTKDRIAPFERLAWAIGQIKEITQEQEREEVGFRISFEFEIERQPAVPVPTPEPTKKS